MELHFNKPNGPIDESIDRLIDLAGDVHHPDIVREMVLAALKAGQDADKRADLKMMNATLKEMRFTAKIFGPYRHIRKVAVFGSARTREDHPVYQMAKDFGRKLAESGYMVVTGAGPGIMQAVNEGAGPEHSFGVNIRLPFEQQPNPVLRGNPRLITYKYFFNRKVALIREASGLALFPGGFGTLDEGMETLTLIQTGKGLPVPVVLVEQPGGTYWSSLLEFFEEQMLHLGLISETDFSLFERVDSADDGVERINRFFRRYHSIRYVDGKLVIRMTSPLDEAAIHRLSIQFQNLLAPGGLMRTSPSFPEEEDEPELANLPRLLVDFNRESFGLLRSLINAINDEP